jgi:hypothetical protein
MPELRRGRRTGTVVVRRQEFPFVAVNPRPTKHMTVIAPAGNLSSPSAPASARPSYAHVHWYMLAAFGVVFLGFWPSFYQPRTSGTTLRNIHGVTSTLWYLALVVQPCLVTHAYVRWHRRVAIAVIALLPVVTVTALMNTRMMLTRSALPPAARPLIAYLDVTLVALFVVLFLLGLRNRKTPAAHKRYMVSTALVGFPPAITRFVSRGSLGCGVDFGACRTRNSWSPHAMYPRVPPSLGRHQCVRSSFETIRHQPGLP